MTDQKNPNDSAGRPAALRLAEWVTFGLSLLLVLAVAGLLTYEALRGDSPVLAADLRPLLDQVSRTNGRYVLPVEVKNLGHRTMHKFKGQLSYQMPGAKEPETIDLELDYLGERSSQKIYILLDADPRTLSISAKPVEYQLN